jgi:hypothetical protein
VIRCPLQEIHYITTRRDDGQQGHRECALGGGEPSLNHENSTASTPVLPEPSVISR